MRGQYAHNTKIYGNSLPFGGWNKFKGRGVHKSTIATWLDNQSGYQTGLFGKYMNNYRDKGHPPGLGPLVWVERAQGGLVQRQRPGAREAAGQAGGRLPGLQERPGVPGQPPRQERPRVRLRQLRGHARPLLLRRQDDDKFKGAGVPRSPSFNEDSVADKPAYLRNPKLSGSEISELDQSYRKGLRSLMRVDRFVGRASDLLRSKGEMDNTYFVFYTDNGAHFGQHRFGHGKLQPYEEDTNFPLIVRGPGIPHGAKSAKLVGNHDIAPTLARMGGTSFPAFVDGRSFLSSGQGS